MKFPDMKSSLDLAIKQARVKYPQKKRFDKNRCAHLCVGANVAKYLPKQSSILDVGSGPCEAAGMLVQLGYEVSACDDLSDYWHLEGDNRRKILEYASNVGVDFHLIEDNNLPFKKNSFDMVMSNAVLEHLHESPRNMVNKMMEIIKPNGLFFITVPNAVNIRKRLDVLIGKTNLPPFKSYYWHPGDSWRGHIREYVKDDLKQLANYLDLEILEISAVDMMLENLPKQLHGPYLFITKFFNSWKDSWILVGRKKLGWVEKVLTDDELLELWPSNHH
ncbi:class I SAM-dependent methyltransferase [Pseudomonadota bacterium]|nr:class I SAM-dependent methyltransferase [Pseudomonadota bacterium]